MARTSKLGEKFGPRYGVKPRQIYQGDPGEERLKIPPPGHFLHDADSPLTHDEFKVRQIDEDGECSNVVEVWTDKDHDQLYVVDGRETLINVREVNRRRVSEGREPVQLLLQPLAMSEKALVAHLTVRNFHRRAPTPSAYASHIRTQRRAGWPWDKICQFLHVDAEHAERWCRARLPLAFCEPEVRAAFDAGELPLSQAPEFGGRDVDGSDARGREEQLGLLEQKRAEKLEGAGKPRGVSLPARKRVTKALLNGETANLCHKDVEAARAIAAALQYAESGDLAALAEWPDVVAIVEAAVGKKSAKVES